MEGMAYPAVTSSDVANVLLPYPSNYKERQYIGNILFNVDNLIQKADQVIEQTQRLKKGLMQRLLTKGIVHTNFKKTELGEIPEEWQITKLENIVSIRYGIAQQAKQSANGVNLIRATDISDGVVNKEKLLKIDTSSIPKSKMRYLKRGEIIVVRSGVYTGDIGLIAQELEGSIAGYDLIISPKDFVDPYFLTMQLLSHRIQFYFSTLKSRVAQEHLNSKQLSDTNIVLPPIKEQQKIASIIMHVDNLIEKLNNQKKSEENLKKGLIQNLLTGKIRVKV